MCVTLEDKAILPAHSGVLIFNGAIILKLVTASHIYTVAHLLGANYF